MNKWLRLLIQLLQAIESLPFDQQEQVANSLQLGGDLGQYTGELRQHAQQTDPDNPNAGVGQTT